jgi:hypothetical protein
MFSAISYLLDECQRGELWWHVKRHNALGANLIDCARLGDLPGQSLRAQDAEVLGWAEEAGRILVTRDRSTMGIHLAAHLQLGRRSPGVFIVRPGKPVAEVLEFLVCAAFASEPEDWADRIEFIP